MKTNIEKRCPKCQYHAAFDFTFCPHCGKKYRNIRGKKIRIKPHST